MHRRRQKFDHILFLQNSISSLFLCKNVQNWNQIKLNGNKQITVKNIMIVGQNARCQINVFSFNDFTLVLFYNGVLF